MKNHLRELLKNLTSKGTTVGKDKCIECSDTIDAFNENEFYRINSQIYCGVMCYYNRDKKKSGTPKKETKKVAKKKKVVKKRR